MFPYEELEVYEKHIPPIKKFIDSSKTTKISLLTQRIN